MFKQTPTVNGTPTPLLVDERTAAKLLGVSQRTLFTLRSAGQIPHVKLRGRVLYSPPALSKMIEEKIREAIVTGSREPVG